MNTTTQQQQESKLQHDFSIFQINYNGTRLMRYVDLLVYNCGKTDEAIESAIKEANKVIEEHGLNLIAERNTKSAILQNTLIIKSKD